MPTRQEKLNADAARMARIVRRVVDEWPVESEKRYVRALSRGVSLDTLMQKTGRPATQLSRLRHRLRMRVLEEDVDEP